MTGSHRPGIARNRPAARVDLGGIAHETNTVNPVPTGLAAFRERAMLLGEALSARARGAPNALGGVAAAAEAAGVSVIPTVFASAMPGGVVTAEAHQHLSGALLDRLRVTERAPWPPSGLAGVVLVLHGAMVAEDEDDVEGVLLRDVRAVVDATTAVVAVIDSHAHVCSQVIEYTDFVLSYATCPHSDTFEFRAAFEALVATVIQASGPGLSGPDLAGLPYRRLRRPISPLDCEVRYLD